jgi:hypothetical protein
VSSWSSNSLLPALFSVAVLLLVLWPTRRGGERLLRNWGVPSPAPAQATAALRYLWQRRLLYVALFLVVPPLFGLIWRDGTNLSNLGFFVPVLAAMLIAELVAALRPVSGVRIASLDRRTWRDLVPRWAVAVAAMLVGLTVVAVGVGLAVGAPVLPAVAHVVVCLVVVGLLVRLTVLRPSVPDEAVDAALRTRTARVAVGVGLAWLGAATAAATSAIHWHGRLTQDTASTVRLVGEVAQLVAVMSWILVASPSRRAPAARR